MHKLVTSDFVSPLFKYSVNILVINRQTRPVTRASLQGFSFFCIFESRDLPPLFSSAFSLREDKQNRWYWLNINWRENGNVCSTFVLFVPPLYKSSMFVPVADCHIKHHLSQCEFASNTCELKALITVLQLCSRLLIWLSSSTEAKPTCCTNLLFWGGSQSEESWIKWSGVKTACFRQNWLVERRC